MFTCSPLKLARILHVADARLTKCSMETMLLSLFHRVDDTESHRHRTVIGAARGNGQKVIVKLEVF